MAQPEPHRHARQAETRFRCRRCALPYVMAGLYRRQTVRCHYCGALLQVTQVVRRPRRRR
jgi:DNA-directed RNA polymerase subunit RPC12/RpoP